MVPVPAATSHAACGGAEPDREDGEASNASSSGVAAGPSWPHEQGQPPLQSQVVLPAPALRVAPRRRGSAGAESRHASALTDTGAADATLALYGVWQTARYEPPPHVPGQPLPRNVHGNIELWGGNRAFLPAGLEWLPTKEARAAAKDVGVECVDVVVSSGREGSRVAHWHPACPPRPLASPPSDCRSALSTRLGGRTPCCWARWSRPQPPRL